MNQAMIRFYASVNPGTTATLINVSQARADNYSQIVSNPVVITLGVVLGALSVKTGASLQLCIYLYWLASSALSGFTGTKSE